MIFNDKIVYELAIKILEHVIKFNQINTLFINDFKNLNTYWEIHPLFENFKTNILNN
ncbi:hypothetical protein [Mycoplasma zalophi]|uniref:hypothetical protein n=1 Tax=Mycoplasma zalophi TaxID=191287 RepID=UPI001C11326C|nr:hypothetical protein [Mycoplasma zalophi]MBU4690829.1 hypothetical protein [Mycoplasma zalophi]